MPSTSILAHKHTPTACALTPAPPDTLNIGYAKNYAYVGHADYRIYKSHDGNAVTANPPTRPDIQQTSWGGSPRALTHESAQAGYYRY